MDNMSVDERQNTIVMNQIKANAIVVSNVLELATSVITNIAGKEIADTFGEQTVNRAILSNLIANRINETILQ